MRRRPQFSRADRIGHLMHEQVTRIVSAEIRAPLARHVQVTATKLSPDLGHLRVHYVMHDCDEPNQRAQEMLERAAGFVASALRHSLGLKRRPTVVFRFDREYVRMRRVKDMLSKDPVPGEPDTAPANPEDLTV